MRRASRGKQLLDTRCFGDKMTSLNDLQTTGDGQAPDYVSETVSRPHSWLSRFAKDQIIGPLITPPLLRGQGCGCCADTVTIHWGGWGS